MNKFKEAAKHLFVHLLGFTLAFIMIMNTVLVISLMGFHDLTELLRAVVVLVYSYCIILTIVTTIGILIK